MTHYTRIIAIAGMLGTCSYAVPYAAFAGEIQYGSLVDQHGDTLLLEYKGPAGTQYFTCSTEGSCSKKGKTAPTLFPEVMGTRVYVKSADGTRAVRSMSVNGTTYYFLYDISGSKAKKIAQVPYTTAGATVYFSKNNNAIIFKNGLTYTRYDIATKKLASVTLAQDLAFFSISPNATYVTGYNYNTGVHELWRFSDGTKLNGPSAMQSYLEWSEDESRIAYLDDVDGFRTLFTMAAADLGKASPASRVQLTKPRTETEDYLFVGNTLYFLANVDGPLAWDLWRYDGTNTVLVEKTVSYGDFLKRVRVDGKSYLAYLKTTGKNTDVVLLSPNPGKPNVFAAVKASPASSKVNREVKVYGGRTGVLLSPTKSSGARNLFIWMHGGPQRQVAIGYHPYLSYAVYDELLERLAEGGNYVFKIDYTGSTGYGADFREALDMNIGNTDIQDIKNAITAIKKDKSIGKVYLIGNSYGAYMALRGVVAMPELIDGAISINGVSDWYGLISQIPSSPFRELFNGVPDTVNLDAYKQASVFVGMDRLKTSDKVLVVWGEQDSTVPTWQSTKYVDFAKQVGVNVSTLSFPNEDHIIRERKNLNSLCAKVTSVMGVKGVTCK